jgi:gamma-glutamyltranspeptidase/glutathione hydrolase
MLKPDGSSYGEGDRLVQADLANTLEAIANRGPQGFYEGEIAEKIAAAVRDAGGVMTADDFRNYRVKERKPVTGKYRGYGIASMPPPSSGGIHLIEMLNILEGFDVAGNGFGSARNVHLTAEAMRRAFADRARFLGDPAFNPQMPIARLISKDYAAALRSGIALDCVSASSPTRFEWPYESDETTHFSVVDEARGAVSLTYTLEAGYGSKIIAPGTGFLLNNEMGDFNAGPGLTDAEGLIGTEPNLAMPGKRMLSSMTPTIIAKDGTLFMVTGGLGGRTIINTVLHTILNVVDHGMNAQESVDAPRFHHQWLPDRIQFERHGLSPDTQALLRSWGHSLAPVSAQGVAEVIVVSRRNGKLEGGVDRRAPDGGAVGY